MPALFIGHGSPMNTLEENRFTAAWRRIGQALPRPAAVLVVSAHWYIRGAAVTAMAAPRTIHDFYGFPQELFAFRYPAPGSPALADRVRALLHPLATADDGWGIDHGAWSVLAHLFPAADIPVVQLSIDNRQSAQFHYETGARLAALRDEGVLILGSGNVVHNLGMLRWDAPDAAYDWALRFEQAVKDRLLRRDHAALVDWERLDAQTRLAVPTPEHYLPLLYCIATQQEDEPVSFPVEGIDRGSFSMLTVGIGAF
ncbi:MAG: 4,5-DOPA dioxygenase extradiol [Rhodocyclales bacterium]|nr:4,5-DOPA dioxygenase extradiol [Rhodocyclales bacterium]